MFIIKINSVNKQHKFIKHGQHPRSVCVYSHAVYTHTLSQRYYISDIISMCR